MNTPFGRQPDDSGLPPELARVERELGRLAAPSARPEFRALLRARFLAGDFESEAEEVLERWSAPPARAEFRDALRERFLEGAREPAPAPARPARSRPAPVRRPRLVRRLGLVAAAAALVLVLPFLPLGRAQDTGWHVVGSPDVPTVSIDGETVPSIDSARLHEKLSGPECSLESGARSVRFARGRSLLFQVEPDTRVRLAPFFALRGEGLVVDLERGAVVLSLSSGFTERIVVKTPYGRVEVHGRAVGVELVGGGLCICCLEGAAQLQTPDRAEHEVSSGTTLYVAPDGSLHTKTDGVAHPEPVGAARAVALEQLDP